MGCNSSYLEPNLKEVNSRIAAKNLSYALKALGMKVPYDVEQAAEKFYGNPNNLDYYVVTLCNICRGMTKEQENEIIYNGKSKEARSLAEWWEKHLKADEEREIKEKKEAIKSEIKRKVNEYEENLISELSEEDKKIYNSGV